MDNIACQDSDGFFADDSRSSLVGMIRRHHVVPRTNLLRVLHISISFGRCCLRCFFFRSFFLPSFLFPVRRSAIVESNSHSPQRPHRATNHFFYGTVRHRHRPSPFNHHPPTANNHGNNKNSNSNNNTCLLMQEC